MSWATTRGATTAGPSRVNAPVGPAKWAPTAANHPGVTSTSASRKATSGVVTA
ncbi:MAG: hypothetical protein R2704_13970 [Microthrixaceae bacterium]